MDHKILIDANPRALALARDSYHGGRTEAFRIGRVKGPIYVLDVNSMYPYVMRERDYPTVLKAHLINPTASEMARWLDSKCVVARCLVKTRVPAYAVVSKGKLVFPVGQFHAVLTTPHLFRAIQSGDLVSVSEAAVYDKAPVFTRFVDELYSLRLAAGKKDNAVESYLLKILMNSLYGKFGQKGGVWTKVGDTEDWSVKTWIDYDLEEGTQVRMRQLAGIVQQRQTDGESWSSHPAIAAHVTAYARAYLWSIIDRAGRENVVYCDTDSVWVNRKGYLRLRARVHKSDIGALKLEHVYPWIVVHGAKDYETPDAWKCKGVSHKAKWVGERTVVQEQWSSLVGLIGAGSLSAPRTRLVRKTLERVYDKGRVLPSGHVLPLTLCER